MHVWTTPAGDNYHVTTDCDTIHQEMTERPLGEVADEYLSRCAVCGRTDGQPEIVVPTVHVREFGDCYHLDPDCGYLDDCVTEMTLIEAAREGLSLCSRCDDETNQSRNELTTVCPKCDSASIVTRTSDAFNHVWLCRECRHTFDEPDKRPRHSGGLNPDTPAAKVSQMTPSEVFDDD
jgi:ribosomal protein L37AE/L43A